jgi:hypothetical protein
MSRTRPKEADQTAEAGAPDAAAAARQLIRAALGQSETANQSAPDAAASAAGSEGVDVNRHLTPTELSMLASVGLRRSDWGNKQAVGNAVGAAIGRLLPPERTYREVPRPPVSHAFASPQTAAGEQLIDALHHAYGE